MYDLEPWKRPTGLQENVVEGQPKPDPTPAPGAPTRDTDRVSLEIHRLEADLYPLAVERAFAPPGSWTYNPSVCVHQGRLVANVRILLDGDRRENVIGEIDDSWTLTRQRMLKSEAKDPPFKWLPGFEDMRLISRGERMQAISSVCARTQDGRFRAVAAMLDLDEALTTIRAAHYQPSKFAEKNWMPLVEGDTLRFVYQTEPFSIVLPWSDALHSVQVTPPGAQGMIRGGSQLLPLPDGRFLACVHENRAPAGHGIGRYVHRFVLFDRFLQLERKSGMFVFRETGIEFCAGMALWRGKLVLSFGLQDKSAWLAVTTLEKALATVGVESSHDHGGRTAGVAERVGDLPQRIEPPDDGRDARGVARVRDEDRPTTRLVPDAPSGAALRSDAATERGGDPARRSGGADAGSDPTKETGMQYDLEPHLRPRVQDEAKLEAEAAKTVAAFQPPNAHGGRAPTPGQGPSDEELFTKIIPGLPGWCSVAKSRRLAELVADRHARLVVEIGVFGGRSLLALGVGARRAGASVLGIDPYTQAASLEGANAPENDAWWKERAAGGSVDYEATHKIACDAAALIPGVQVLRAKSLDVAPSVEAGTVDVIHIDGNHSEETSCADVRAWLPKLSLGAIVVMDDVDWKTTKKAQAMLAEAGCEEMERYSDGGESWAVYQCIGSRLKVAGE